MSYSYSVGTISVSAGSTAVTGSGTAFVTANIRPGDQLVAAGLTGIVAAVNSNTSLTLVRGWPGSTLSGAAYDLLYRNAADVMTAKVQSYLDQFDGAPGALAALNGGANQLPYFTGADTMAQTAFPANARSLLADAAIPLALAQLDGGADQLPYFTGAEAVAQTALTPFARTLLDDGTASQVRTTLGLASGALAAVVGSDADVTAGRLLTTGAGPAQAFRRGNVLGAVSQAGGVPTGALIERGSNASGEFVRFADGTQICSCFGATGNTSTADGALFRRGTDLTASFPASFTVAPFVAPAQVTNAALMTSVVSATTTAVTYRLRATSALSGLTDSVFFVAFGRWF